MSKNKEGKEISAEKKVKYIENAPELTEFTMTYNGQTYDLLSDKKQNVTFILESFHGKTPFSFNVKYKNPENIGSVYISSIRNQTRKTVDAEWDEAGSSYVFNGYFDDNDHEYVPGKILVEYTKKREERPSLSKTQNDFEKLLNDNKEAFKDIKTTVKNVSDNKVVYNCDLSKIEALHNMNQDSLNLTIETFGNALESDWGTMLTNTFSTAENIYSYLDENGDKYLLKQGFTKEGMVSLVYDISSNKILKYIIDSNSEFEQYSFGLSTAEKISSKLTFVSTVLKPVKEIYDINEDYDGLLSNIETSGMNYKEQAVARQRAKDLYNDRLTIMGALTIGMTGPIGVAASVMLASVGILGDYFNSIRTANILSGKYGSKLNWSIDPSGYIYTGVTSNRVAGAKVTAWWIPYDEDDKDFWIKPDESKAQIWDASEYDQSNPMTTDNDGNYAWDVPEGWWRVQVEKEGYETAWSDWVTVPPVQTDVNIGLTPKGGSNEDETIVTINNYVYQITKAATDGTGTVTFIGASVPTSAVSIPATIDVNGTSYLVTAVGAKALYRDTAVTTVYIGANVAVIGNNAFDGCSKLAKVSGGANLKMIGSRAFAGCPKLKSFSISSKVLWKIGTYAFSGDKKLKTINVKYTTKLTKSGVKKSLKGSKVKTVKVKKSKVKKYKKFFTKKNCGRKVKVKK